MKILITIPAFGHHGGLNVIIQWANRLTRWHDVYLYILNGKHQNNSWCQLSKNIEVCNAEMIWKADCLIFTSPHSSHLLDLVLPNQKCFLFIQMTEEMFRPADVNWLLQCKKFYESKYPKFMISEWNMKRLTEISGKQGAIFSKQVHCGDIYVKDQVEVNILHYIGNGIDLSQFPISHKPKDGKTVLVEGWECNNPTKDIDAIGPKVALRLKKEGYRILAYSGLPISRMTNVPHEYHYKPALSKLNELYERATILIKATKYDARSTAPIEAMTKGTVTARSIIEGDDDLIDCLNCRRCGYDEESLYQTAKALLESKDEDGKFLREKLANRCYKHIKENCNWEKIMEEVNEIISYDK